MQHEVVLDMSQAGRVHRVARSRRRSVKDKARYWNVRFKAFIKAGFTEDEAAWGASDGLSLKNPTVKRIIKHRKALVAWYMKTYDYTRAKSIEMASKDLDAKLDREDVEEKNLYYELEI